MKIRVAVLSLMVILCMVGCQKNPPVYTYTCEPDTLTLRPGEKASLTVTLTPELKKNQPTNIFSSTDTLVATVSAEGEVTALNYGRAVVKVRCTFNGYSPLATCLVLVPDSTEVAE